MQRFIINFALEERSSLKKVTAVVLRKLKTITTFVWWNTKNTELKQVIDIATTKFWIYPPQTITISHSRTRVAKRIRAAGVAKRVGGYHKKHVLSWSLPRSFSFSFFFIYLLFFFLFSFSWKLSYKSWE